MSYILDALKRADAERERGVVPGLYARQVTAPAGRNALSSRRSIWLALAVALALGAVATGLAVWRAPGDGAPQRLLPEPVVATPAAPRALPPVLPATMPVALAPPAPAPLAQVASVVTAAPVAATPTHPVKAASTPLPLPVAKASAGAAPSATVPVLADLSEDLRRQIPALAISGAVYSENPAQRLLLVNNQVLSQGSEAAPEVKLEEIGAKSSIFSFRGSRFRLAH